MWGGTPWPWAPIASSQNRSRPTPWSPWSTRCCGRRKAARRSREVRDGAQTRLAARGRLARRRRRDEHLGLARRRRRRRGTAVPHLHRAGRPHPLYHPALPVQRRLRRRYRVPGPERHADHETRLARGAVDQGHDNDARKPSLVIGMAFGFLVIEFGFV